MAKALNFLCISGSLRAGSYNTMALKALKAAAPAGITFTDADYSAFPVYNSDVQAKGIPAAVTAMGEQVLKADGIIIATPEYNYSVPGGLKNAIDWVSRLNPQPFNEKPVAILGASMGMLGTARAQYDLRKMMVFLNAFPINKPEVFIGAAQNKFSADGKLNDDATAQMLKQLVEALAAWAQRLKA